MNENTTDPNPDRTVLHVTISDSFEALDDALDRAQAAMEGRPDDIDGPTNRLNFHSATQFQGVFNATNIELLQTIAREHPQSIRALARLVDRDVSPVHRDLKELESYGLVEFVKEGRAKRPVVGYDEIQIEVPLARACDRCDAVPAENRHTISTRMKPVGKDEESPEINSSDHTEYWFCDECSEKFHLSTTAPSKFVNESVDSTEK